MYEQNVLEITHFANAVHLIFTPASHHHLLGMGDAASITVNKIKHFRLKYVHVVGEEKLMEP